jgi:hypothetical protein
VTVTVSTRWAGRSGRLAGVSSPVPPQAASMTDAANSNDISAKRTVGSK